jgi:sensor histidine kinase YesM
LLILALRIVIKPFSGNKKNVRLSALPFLVIPVLFITLVEAVVADSIYGYTMIWDTEEGLVFPIVNNMELLVLRLFAFGGLLSVLIAYQKLETSIEHERKIHLLEQLTKNQEAYGREAQSRYEQTCSFRHDIKNHLLVLHQLLKEGKSNEANEYLRNLEVVSDALSFQVKTGNTTVDALLSSKLAVAAQIGIHLQYSVLIPKLSYVSDMDWCIILSNVLDNAISACEDVSDQDRFICLSGRQKGNVYLLKIENSCRNNTKLPTEGIGLSNIKAVLQKYSGKVDIEVINNVFKLNALFIIPQQSQDILQQFY